MKQGSLIIVGSGIKSVAHLTLEAKGWICQSDVVLYCVADPATEVWIKQNCRHSVDLYQFYGNDKRRLDTYHDMADAMLDYVRKGKDVCGVFYGHPGVFVYPSHRAVKIAREEGYRAAILPAISALDCLWADLGVDPSLCGSQTVEATDLLLRKRRLNTDGHVVIWQVGCVGDLGFNFSGYDARNFGVLVDYLKQYYKDDQPVTHYQGSQYPMCAPQIEKLTIGELPNAKVTGISTLYIPPQDEHKTDYEMARRLGLVKPPQSAEAGQKSSTGKVAQAGGNGKENKTGANKRPGGYGSRYVPAPEESGLADFIAEISENPRLLAQFKREPELTAATHADLTEIERNALLSLHPGRIRMAIKTCTWNDPRFAGLEAQADASVSAASSSKA